MAEDLMGHNVVSLVDRLVDMAFPEIGQMQRYWNSLRGTWAVPLRSEVDPRAIETCLEFAFILERIAPGLARFRLAGTHINDLIGMEVRGMPISAIFDGPAREELSQIVEAVFSEPSVAEVDLSAQRALGKPPLEGRLLLLPLKSDFGDVSRILGCMVTRGPIGRTPRRFIVDSAEITPVSALPFATDVAQSPPAEQPRPAAPSPEGDTPRDRGPIDPTPPIRPVDDDGFSEPPAAFRNAPRPKRTQKPRLYVVRRDDKD